MAERSVGVSDRCPGVLDLHVAEDGALARIRLPGGRVSAAQLDAIIAAAALGSGLVDLTSRANLQVRGLPVDAGATLEAIFERGDLLPSISHERVRNILASPLAGRHSTSLTETDDLVDELDAALVSDPQLAQLSGRFLFAVDDGSALIGRERPDVALVAETETTFSLALAGARTSIAATRRRAAAVALQAAHAFLDIAGGAWRLADLEQGPRDVASALGGRLEAPPSAGSATTLRPGTVRQRDGQNATTALAPLGRLDADQLAGLRDLLRAGSDLRISPWRTVTLVDLPPGEIPEIAASLEQLGLVLSSESGWFGLTACAGLGACAKARIDVRAAAGERSRVRDHGSPVEHWSACPRRCGEPKGPGPRVVAEDDALVLRDDAETRILGTVEDALAALPRAAVRA